MRELLQGINLSDASAHSAKSGVKSFRSPRPDASRMLAYNVVSEVNQRGGFANLLLPRQLADSDLELRDKGFVTELVYGTLRMQGMHDWIIQQVVDRDFSDIDSGIVDVLRIGIHQMFHMRVPKHAAVSATVELARKVVGESKATYVNATLRAISRSELADWLFPLETMDDLVARYAILYSHPEWIVSAYFDLLKSDEEVAKALFANNVPAQPTLVSWPGRSTQEELLTYGGVATRYSPYGATTTFIPSEVDHVRKRLAGIQDEGSQIVASIFATASESHMKWLDLCAGPGGKAALLSGIAGSKNNTFTANEVSEARAKLVDQVVVNARVWVGDGREIATHGESFGAVLADVPCTGIGALRRRPEVRWRRTPADLANLILLQKQLLDAAVAVTEPGGLIAYVTCSPHLAETKLQVRDALVRHRNISQLSIAPFLPAGLEDATVGDNLQLWTHRHDTDAMFMALFQRV